MPLPELAPNAPETAQRVTAGIAGIGASLPAATVPNGPIAARLGLEDGWIERRTGVRERRIARADERVSDFATSAGGAALADAGLDAAELDLVLVATLTQDEITPNTAPLVAQALGAGRAGAFDVGAACTGFIAALAAAAGAIESGRSRHVLVIGADFLSRLTNPDDRATAALFGDGAGAVVVTAGGPGTVGPVVLGTAPDPNGAIIAHHHEGFLRMDGHDTFKAAVTNFAHAVRLACEAADVAVEDVDVFAFHQANGRILTAVAERLGVDPDRVLRSVERHANTSAASIPLALADAAERNALPRPGIVALAAVGAGFTWAGAVVELGASS